METPKAGRKYRPRLGRTPVEEQEQRERRNELGMSGGAAVSTHEAPRTPRPKCLTRQDAREVPEPLKGEERNAASRTTRIDSKVEMRVLRTSERSREGGVDPRDAREGVRVVTVTTVLRTLRPHPRHRLRALTPNRNRIPNPSQIVTETPEEEDAEVEGAEDGRDDETRDVAAKDG